MSGKRQAASADAKGQILDVEAVGSIGHRPRACERDALAAALSGKTRKLKPRWRSSEQPPARADREAARIPAQVEVAGRGVPRSCQLDAGDRLSADFGP